MRRVGNFLTMLAMLMLVTTPVRADVPPAGFTSTGNAAADMAYALNRNRGLGQAAATKIGYYVGEEAAGTSLMSRIFKRGPMKRLWQVAAVAGIGYFVYQLATGQWAATGTQPEKQPLNQNLTAIDWSNIQRFVGYPEYFAFRQEVPPGAYVLFSGEGNLILVFSRWVTDVQWRQPSSAVEVVYNGRKLDDSDFSGGTFQTASGSRMSSEAESITEADGVVWRRGFVSFTIAQTETQPDILFRWVNAIPASQQQDQTATAPGDIPGNATVINIRIAEDLNDLVKRALEKHPDDPELKTLADNPFTAEEIAQTVTGDAPERLVANRLNPDPKPLAQPQTQPSGSTNPATPVNTGSTVGEGGISIPDVTPKLPGVSVAPFTYEPGQCPTFQFGADQFAGSARNGLVAFGYPDHLPLERHCILLNEIAPWFRPMLLVFITIVCFGVFRGKGG